MSSLLTRHAGIQELMDKGELIPDTLVGDSLLDVIFSPDETDGSGLIVDGFPRTALQVDFVKMLHDKMNQLHLQHADGPDAWRFPRTSFKVSSHPRLPMGTAMSTAVISGCQFQ